MGIGYVRPDQFLDHLTVIKMENCELKMLRTYTAINVLPRISPAIQRSRLVVIVDSGCAIFYVLFECSLGEPLFYIFA